LKILLTEHGQTPPFKTAIFFSVIIHKTFRQKAFLLSSNYDTRKYWSSTSHYNFKKKFRQL